MTLKLQALLLAACCLLPAETKDDMKMIECAAAHATTAVDFTDLLLDTYAAAARCEKQGKGVKCVIDVMDVFKDALKVAKYIMEAVKACDLGDSLEVHCAQGIDELALVVATVTQTSTQIATSSACTKCVSACQKEKKNPNLGLEAVVMSTKCETAASKAFGSLGAALMKIKKAAKSCKKNPLECVERVGEVTEHIAGMGEYILKTIGTCKVLKATIQGCGNEDCVSCYTRGIDIVKAAAELAQGGSQVAEACMKVGGNKDDHGDHHRLWQELTGVDEVEPQGSSKPAVTVALALCIPAMAILGFFTGSKYQSRKAQKPEAYQGVGEGARDVLSAERSWVVPQEFE